MRAIALACFSLVLHTVALAGPHEGTGGMHRDSGGDRAGHNWGGNERNWGRGPNHYGRSYPGPGYNNDLGTAIVGGAIGTMFGNWFNPPTVVVVPAEAPRYSPPVLVPWTPPWFSSCATRYRSFDAGTGFYLGFDGQRHFCQ